jgi:hypothetical protein
MCNNKESSAKFEAIKSMYKNSSKLRTTVNLLLQRKKKKGT